MRKSAFLLFVVLTACAGKTTSSEPATASNATTALSADDLTKQWDHVSVLSQQKRIFRGADAFYAFTSRETSPGGGKSASFTFSAIYRSTDGVTWSRSAMLENGSSAFAHVTDVAYGNGHFIAAGWANGVTGELATSADGATWTPFATVATGVNGVAFANDRFLIGTSPNDFQYSTDGTAWTPVTRPLMQMRSAAYGNGAYVVFGSCGMMTSTDGATWTDPTPSCGSAGAICVTPPGGGPSDAKACGYTSPGFFGAGKFWVMGTSSTDGKTWTPVNGPIPTTSAGDYLFDDGGGTSLLKAWTDGGPVTTIPTTSVTGDAPPNSEPPTVTLHFPNGVTCNDHRCIIVGTELYLLQ